MKIDDCVENVKWMEIGSVDFGYFLTKNYQPTIIKHLRLG